MSVILYRDPDRRCKPLAEWPEVDRDRWLEALVPGGLLEDGGRRARHSPFSNRNAVYGYGRWLTWVDRQGLLAATISPADRITPAAVLAYVADLERRNAVQTVLNRVQELKAVAVVIDPAREWSWFDRIYSRIWFRRRPVRPKRARMVPIGELYDLGITLIAAAEREATVLKRASTFRDGLIVALLAARQLRLRNLVGLVLERTLVRRGEQWWIEFPASETKTRQPFELPWPEPLAAPLEAYFARHRPVLAQIDRRSARPPGDALWISQKGSPMSRSAIYTCVTTRTGAALGRPVNPHLFRDCAATSIAGDDPRHIGIAWRLLGHSSPATVEKYYNQARSVDASRRMQSFLTALRRDDTDPDEPPT